MPIAGRAHLLPAEQVRQLASGPSDAAARGDRPVRRDRVLTDTGCVVHVTEHNVMMMNKQGSSGGGAAAHRRSVGYRPLLLLLATVTCQLLLCR